MNKSQIISLLISIGAIFDTIWGVISDNQGIIVELGISPKITKIIMLIGLIYTAFSKRINPAVFGIGGSNPPPTDPKDK